MTKPAIDKLKSGKRVHIRFFMILGVLMVFTAYLPGLFNQLQRGDAYGVAVDIAVPNIPHLQVPRMGLNIVFFGYLNCGTVCPEQLHNLIRLHSLMEGYPVQFIFVTLAPDMDHDHELQRVMRSLGSNFHYYRPGSVLEAQQLALSYTDIAARYQLNGHIEINHQGRLFVVTPEKRLTRIYSPKQSNPDKIKLDLIELMSRHHNTGV